jgi:S-adenosylmethionine:tRNA ribosyltransferase-isomerase
MTHEAKAAPRGPARGGAPGAFDFELPPALEAGEPPEARGLGRDEVRLMVSHAGTGAIAHARFGELTTFLDPGDLIVINTSGTLAAALPALRHDGAELELHLSTKLPDGRWIVELRAPSPRGTLPFGRGVAGERLALPGGGLATLVEPKTRGAATAARAILDAAMTAKGARDGVRLWIARLELPAPLADYLAMHGSPIRYGYVERAWPIEYYQTTYANEPGSAEMPSAGRAFTPELIARLVAMGVMVAPIVLHTGVASLEEHEPPYEEYYRVPAATADLVMLARASYARVVAVGTTVVRALESATGADGVTRPSEGWTDLVITPECGLRAVNALLTGLHEPRASHLAMLAALVGTEHLKKAYRAALRGRYLWHEFGDLHLILP